LGFCFGGSDNRAVSFTLLLQFPLLKRVNIASKAPIIIVVIVVVVIIIIIIIIIIIVVVVVVIIVTIASYPFEAAGPIDSLHPLL
jgi:hypothetical protein